ncbi:hypothetical protein J7K74_02280 [Candidatus Woesearchaeota archaeon]|nr:hypothetical protein [Candidatus Woesearchaeota archaeon]
MDEEDPPGSKKRKVLLIYNEPFQIYIDHYSYTPLEILRSKFRRKRVDIESVNSLTRAIEEIKESKHDFYVSSFSLFVSRRELSDYLSNMPFIKPEGNLNLEGLVKEMDYEVSLINRLFSDEGDLAKYLLSIEMNKSQSAIAGLIIYSLLKEKNRKFLFFDGPVAYPSMMLTAYICGLITLDDLEDSYKNTWSNGQNNLWVSSNGLLIIGRYYDPLFWDEIAIRINNALSHKNESLKARRSRKRGEPLIRV